MIASDHNRRFNLAPFDQLVHGHAKFSAFAITEPANARGQPLKLNALACEPHPARERLVFRKQLQSETIGARDVRRVPAQGHPPEWAAAFAKKRPNVFRNESRNIERVLDACFFRLVSITFSASSSDQAILSQ